ncbi:cell division protein FtsQ/DivIB, partial [Vibrio antiquarius]
MLNIALNDERPNTDNNRGRQEKILGALFFVVVVTLISSVLYSAISWMWDDQRLPLSKIVLQGKLEYVQADDVQA